MPPASELRAMIGRADPATLGALEKPLDTYVFEASAQRWPGNRDDALAVLGELESHLKRIPSAPSLIDKAMTHVAN